jgi:hypothetical protein
MKLQLLFITVVLFSFVAAAPAPGGADELIDDADGANIKLPAGVDINAGL